MEAKLYLKRGKKILELGNGVKYDVTRYVRATLDYDEEYEVFDDEFKIENGVLTKIKFDGRVEFFSLRPIGQGQYSNSKGTRKESNQNRRHQHKGKPKNPSQAPYNFASIDEEIIEYKQNVEDRKLYGYIDYDITTLTPTFIRGEGTGFYKEGSNYAIPGSSQRGMLLTICEILSSARFKNFDADRYMFDRRTYNQESKILAGFLTYDGKFSITSTAKPNNRKDTSGTEFKYIFNSNDVVFTTGSLAGVQEWTFKKPSSNAETLAVPDKIVRQYMTDDMRQKNVPHILNCVKEGKVEYLIKIAKNEKNKKTFETKKIVVSIPDCGLPIFYELDGKGEVSYISHCKLGRKRFTKNYGQHIPVAHQQVKNGEDQPVDFVDIMFGSTEQASRIFVEPAFLYGSAKEYRKVVYPQKLQSPKPKSGKNYLKSSNGSHKGGNWNNEADILRGHKLYWHRITDDSGGDFSWREKIVEEEDEKLYPEKIQPLMEGNTFKGRIRYEGISAEELGCLLWALKLKEGCAHKIGMGKPLGLGSVSISNIKHIGLDLKKRYDGLFDSEDWNLGEIDLTDKVEEYISKFKDAIDYKSSEVPARLKEFFHIMKFDANIHAQKEWLEKTKYLTFEEFKHKSKLPDALDIT